MRYYFISYSFVKGGQMRNSNLLINEHPLAWQKRVQQDHEDEERLISYQEVTEEEYNEYYDWIG